MDRHGIGDEQLGASCRPRVHRTLIYCYRKRQKTPRADTAQVIIDALASLGVAITLKELLTAPPKKRRASKEA